MPTGNVRLSVNLSPDSAAALRRVTEREGITLTEALRRLIGYGDVVYEAVKIEGSDVLIRQGDTTREVILL